jgi:1-deoxy-D-xylulose-5-phosphate reductoisomerase
MEPRRVAILGSTGSIGRQALGVIAGRDDLVVCALAAGGNGQLLSEQARQFRPEAVALAETAAAAGLAEALPGGVKVLAGLDAAAEVVRLTRPDLVLNGVVGSAGLASTLAAIEVGAVPAIANKESLVVAGQLVMSAASEGGLTVLPVDSEHSAIFQCLRAGLADEVERVTITASGGALRDWDDERLATASVSDALNHPNWDMGRKITIDSATLINKALEVVEAHWLFGLDADRIDVLIHPQSIVHSMVEFQDGSVIAQMGLPDMSLPIAYALSYPRRRARRCERLDLGSLGGLAFARCEGRFARAVALGYDAIRRGGLAGAVLNGANEAAVEAFLDGRISFGRIVPLVEETLSRTPPAGRLTLDELLRADRWARGEVNAGIAAGRQTGEAIERGRN